VTLPNHERKWMLNLEHFSQSSYEISLSETGSAVGQIFRHRSVSVLVRGADGSSVLFTRQPIRQAHDVHFYSDPQMEQELLTLRPGRSSTFELEDSASGEGICVFRRGGWGGPFWRLMDSCGQEFGCIRDDSDTLTQWIRVVISFLFLPFSLVGLVKPQRTLEYCCEVGAEKVCKIERRPFTEERNTELHVSFSRGGTFDRRIALVGAVLLAAFEL
jgi:hypothetical protein